MRDLVIYHDLFEDEQLVALDLAESTDDV